MNKNIFNIKDNEITPLKHYLNRRQFIERSLATGLSISAFPYISQAAMNAKKGSPFDTDEELSSFDDITKYNNFYEFSLKKEEPAKLAKDFNPDPWTLRIEGECEAPYTLGYEDLTTAFDLEERIYRLRCVEAWSMVVPWTGFELAKLIERAKPTSKAKYVAFTTLEDSTQMPGQKSGVFGSSLPWPYVEGLRMDEAVHPLTILAVGLYGESMPNQNGAPIRLVVPWKYGFKSIKSIVKIEFVETMPPTTWNKIAPIEYGFYANVNPEVDHPRWSQAKERRIGDYLKRETLPFNGYGEWVADLYQGMDLRRNF